MNADPCPWLGTYQDRETRYVEPTELHVCYARGHPADIELSRQKRFCVTDAHPTCWLYRKPPLSASLPQPQTAQESEDKVGPLPTRFPTLRILLWVIGLPAALVALYYCVTVLLFPLLTTVPSVASFLPPLPEPSATPTPTPTSTPMPATQAPARNAPSPAFEFVEPTATLTPQPGGAIYSLVPEADAVGWASGDGSAGNHFGDSFLYAGVFDGVVYHGALQFNLRPIPRGATIDHAALELAGLDATRLTEAGTWEVRLLARETDENWTHRTFQDLHNAPVEWSLSPALAATELEPGRFYSFVLPQEQLRALERRLLDEHYAISFRLDGPYAGENNLFAWDTGYGSASLGQKPRFVLGVSSPPMTPLPTGTPPFIVVTSTPTPLNALTAVAQGETATAVAITTGQPTPTSIYQWTATPVQVVTNTPTPATQATADQISAMITAIARTTGTFTPTPDYLMTATPTPLMIPAAELTPTPAPMFTPPVPLDLEGKILFRSDRVGTEGRWVMSSDGQNVSLLSAAWPYEVAASREALSPDGTHVVYAGQVSHQPAILVRPVDSGGGWPVARFEQGRQVSAPVWSPRGAQIAFVTTESGSPQIWLVNTDGSGLRQLTSDERGPANHPSFSPDGNLLVYWTTGADGRGQVWITSLDGRHGGNISNNVYHEWDPIWIKPAHTAPTTRDQAGAIATSTPTVAMVEEATPLPTPTRVSTSTPGVGRIRDGLQVLYTFEEGGGTTVHDVSGIGLPLDLTIDKPGAVTWMPDALSVDASALIGSAGAASKVTDAARVSNELTIEVWIRPANMIQEGPARIVTLSEDPYNRNVTLGQVVDGYQSRLRTTTTTSNGQPYLFAPQDVVGTGLSHVVLTQNAAGLRKFYVNDVEIASGIINGDFSNWDASYRLALANELTGDRPWLGEFHLVAIYDRALSEDEVSQNYDAGANGSEPSSAVPALLAVALAGDRSHSKASLP